VDTFTDYGAQTSQLLLSSSQKIQSDVAGSYVRHKPKVQPHPAIDDVVQNCGERSQYSVEKETDLAFGVGLTECDYFLVFSSRDKVTAKISRSHLSTILLDHIHGTEKG